MLRLKSCFAMMTVLSLTIGCGTGEKDSKKPQSEKVVAPTPVTSNPVTSNPVAPTSTGKEVTPSPTPTSTPNKVDSDASYVQTNGESNETVACAYNVNGKLSEGKSKEECDRLKKEFEKAVGSAPNTNTQVSCSFNIKGKLYQGKSQAECDKLKKDLGITINLPTLPSVPSVPSTSGGTTQVSCSYNINGKEYKGDTQAECDKLKKDLGLYF